MYRRFLLAGLAKWFAETTATAASPNQRSVKPTLADLFRIAEGWLRGDAVDHVEPLLASTGCCLVRN